MDDKSLSNLINSLSPDDIQSLQSVAQSLFGGQNQGGQQADPPQQNTPLPAAGQNGAAEALSALSGIDPAMVKKNVRYHGRNEWCGERFQNRLYRSAQASSEP